MNSEEYAEISQKCLGNYKFPLQTHAREKKQKYKYADLTGGNKILYKT